MRNAVEPLLNIIFFYFAAVYYWMTVSVEVNGFEYNESDISAWVRT